MSKPFLAFPLHDTQGKLISEIIKITPVLQNNFEKAFVSITPLTEKTMKEPIQRLKSTPFFVINQNTENSLIGEHHVSCYKNAINHTKNTNLINLCTPDRLAYALKFHRRSFLKDTFTGKAPLLFIRSEKAWSTHPKNYRNIEALASSLGEALFGKYLDFGWCHLIISRKDLSNLILKLKRKDLAIYAEIALALKDKLVTKPVDWLAWEDPYILGIDYEKLKKEREKDPREFTKRLGYVLPMLDLIKQEWEKENAVR